MMFRVSLIVVIIVSIPLIVRADCKPVLECAQQAVEAAQAANARVEALEAKLSELEKSLPSRFSCKTVSKLSEFGRGQHVVAEIPKADQVGAVITGGGCEIPKPYGHWPPITVSKPTKKGWHCRADDPPNIPLNLQVRAHVIYCRIEG